ncbi:MAG: YjbQ family protein [Candidatus Dadabacteria bacterium]|nr:YjbQ family protein [Candidatus Dadabacteria bacterium]NIQ13564.1 YjbQ family protein [Candidatus Dadabacteria bacterium]
MTNWFQKEIYLKARGRGFHLITNEIIDEISELSLYKTGIAHIFICHTSASLTLNENVSPDVRYDFEKHFNQMIPENAPYYSHTIEGSDDMPAHIKSSLLGSSITIPVKDGRFLLGTWQGVYLCEHRNRGGARKVVVTIFGEKS